MKTITLLRVEFNLSNQNVELPKSELYNLELLFNSQHLSSYKINKLQSSLKNDINLFLHTHTTEVLITIYALKICYLFNTQTPRYNVFFNFKKNIETLIDCIIGCRSSHYPALLLDQFDSETPVYLDQASFNRCIRQREVEYDLANKVLIIHKPLYFSKKFLVPIY